MTSLDLHLTLTCHCFGFQDTSEPRALLARDNLDQEKLLAFGREAADLVTNKQLPHLEFAKNHYGEDDIAIFDFTAMHRADHSCLARERHGKKLLLSIVGDTLIEVGHVITVMEQDCNFHT